MSIAVPAFLNACIAPSRTGSSVYLVGVPVSAEGRLEVYTVDITDINTPTAKFINNQTDISSWSSSDPKACFDFPGNQADPESPTLVAQFGSKSYFILVYPNGTITNSVYYEDTTYISPKLFSLVGAVGPTNWYATVKNQVSTVTNSRWTSLRFNAMNVSNSQSDNILSVYPTEDPLLTVGTFVATSNTPAQGSHIVFDTRGSGLIYTALSSNSPILTGQDRILSLSNPQSVDMNGITLTDNAIAVTSVSVAYILDKASDGTTIMYKIIPSQSPKLQLVKTPGDVPPFSSYMVATAMNSRIVIYGATSNNAASPTFHNFDLITGSWSGPGLVKPVSSPSPTSSVQPPPEDDSKTPTGAIIGGVVGGLALIALVAFLYIRHRRKSTKSRTDSELPPTSMSSDPRKSDIATPPMQQNFTTQQNLHEQQAYNPHHSYVPPYGASATNNAHASPAMSPTLTYQSEPVIFQSQQPYTYTPPTINAVAQQQQPTIFQPQMAMSGSPVYSTSGGTVSPQTAYVPATQVYAPPAGTHSPQYAHNLQGQGYVS
ncbi:hypothetical protein BG011_001356 [Mortierella polycephala]|uniref:Uncharacterized protein n=1 Tax=Mortierella polycephala TaxID=41804 RepID=A0A9P6Q8X7_9FUNG|nr:hypothetical protein BG011_001356 [Mortierella polycephala]